MKHKVESEKSKGLYKYGNVSVFISTKNGFIIELIDNFQVP